VALGILRLDDDMDKVIYVRIHMLGMADIALVLAMIGLGQFLLAAVYFVLAPFVVHAMANAYYHSEDERKYENSDELTGRIEDNIHNKLALDENTTFDVEFKSKFESNMESSVEYNSGYNKGSSSGSNSESDVGSSDNSDTKSIFESDIVSYTKSEEFKGTISDKLDIVIKEVSTDDIENSSLNKNREKKHD